MRPASWRAEIWRWRPSISTGLRSRGMIAICTASSTTTMMPSSQFCIMMKMIAVSAWPPRNIGCTKASPMKPPSGSTSSLIMVASSACLTLRKWAGGKRRMRS